MSPAILGIAITGGVVHVVEISKRGLDSTLHSIDEWENPFISGHGVPERETLELFAEYLAAFLKVNQVKARDVSIALDTASLFIHRLPIEEHSTNDAIKEQIRWEIEQCFPGIPESEFLSDFHRMSRSPAIRLNEVLSVTVRRRTAQLLEQTLERLGLRLHILDADHFSAEAALRMNYPDTLRRHLALVGIKDGRLDISILKSGNMESYSYALVDGADGIIKEMSSLARESSGFPSIMVYGTGLRTDLLREIRKGSSMLIEAMNPLRAVSIADTLRVAERLSTPSYRFAAALGVALRRD